MELESIRRNVRKRKLLTRVEWAQGLKSTEVSSTQINQIIMNFLIAEGYQHVASRFQAESGTQPSVPLSSISNRVYIRNAIVDGKIAAATEAVNALQPGLLDSNPRLQFRLEQQHLIELIRNEQIDEAVAFAQLDLGPRAASEQDMLKEVEKCMSLIVFGNHLDSPSSSLLALEQRHLVANDVNEVILASQGEKKDSRLCCMIKRLPYEQKRLEKYASFPCLVDVNTGKLQCMAPPTPEEPPPPASYTPAPEEDEEDEGEDDDSDEILASFGTYRFRNAQHF